MNTRMNASVHSRIASINKAIYCHHHDAKVDNSRKHFENKFLLVSYSGPLISATTFFVDMAEFASYSPDFVTI